MPFFERGHIRLYYEDIGKGEPIITNHGLMEDCGYWSETGVTGRLAEAGYRVISMDMRGHGRTVVKGQPYGFDAGTIGNDFGALADYLGIDRFHILCHATGGMAAVRYAMTSSRRLLSLMLTDTGSATAPEMRMKDGQVVAPEVYREGMTLAIEARKNISIEDLMAYIKAEPGPFLFKMAEHLDSERMWAIYEGFLRRSDPGAVGNFQLSFYSDPDPMIEGLRQISCPTLVLLGEFDVVFFGPSEILAREIPDSRHMILNGVGHMTAIEDPERTTSEILDFLKTVAERGKAQRKG